MPLSEYEQRVLEQMEQQLRSDDPKLAQSFSRRGSRTSRVVVGALLVVGGLGALVGGVAFSQIWLGLVGFAAMFAGVLYATSSPAATKSAEPATSGAGGKPTKRASGKSGSSFMQRLDERWDRRRREGR